MKKYIKDNVSYDDILRDTAVLITDYSSIAYDAFYRGANVIFWWKEKDFCMEQYNGHLMLNEDNLAVLEQYIQRKFEEGDIAKAYKESGMMNKAILDARETMLQRMKAGKSGKKARIALKFTNDSGEDFQLGADIDV